MRKQAPQFEHGGQVFTFADKTGLPLDKIIDFSASINPVQPQVDWKSFMLNAQQEVAHYPQEIASDSPSQLRPLLAETFSLNPEEIYLSSGISQAIHQLFSSFKPDVSVLFTPIYGEYLKAARHYAKKSIPYSCAPEEWKHSEIPIPQNSLVVLVNPDTPQGNYASPEQLLPLLNEAHDKNCWVLVDESFLPFITLDPAHSCRQWLSRFPKLIVLQSLTKFYACPGVRIGALFSRSQEMPERLSQVWSLSTLDRLWLSQALQDSEHKNRTQTWLEQCKPQFIAELKQLKIVQKIYPGSANFILVRFSLSAQQLQQYLTPQGILIRPAESFGFSQNHVRLAVKSSQQNKRLISALQSLQEKTC